MKTTSTRIALLIGLALAVPLVSMAATTISTNIQTDGTLSVTGPSVLTGKVGIGTANPRTGLELAGDLIVASSTNLNISNPEFGYGVNNISVLGGGFHTVLNGRINGTNGGTAQLVIGGTVTADTSGSSFNTAVGIGTTVTNSSDSSVFGRSVSITGGTRATAIGYGASITSLIDTIALGNSSAKVWVPGTVGIGTSSPATQLQVTSGASATTTVTVGSLGLSSSKACVNMNAVDGSASSFYVNAAHQLVVEANYCR